MIQVRVTRQGSSRRGSNNRREASRGKPLTLEERVHLGDSSMIVTPQLIHTPVMRQKAMYLLRSGARPQLDNVALDGIRRVADERERKDESHVW